MTDTSTAAIAALASVRRSKVDGTVRGEFHGHTAEIIAALAAERDALRAENQLMEKSLDAEELRVGLSTTGGMWRFWRDKAADAVSENDALRAEVECLREELRGFLALWAVQLAKQYGWSDGELHPAHYDRLKELGARMDDFRPAKLKGASNG